MLSSHEILDVVNNLDRNGVKGRTEALRRANRNGLTSALTPAQAKFLNAVDATSRPRVQATYSHPAAFASASPRTRGDKPLTPAELAWVNRLPADPSQVPFEDAQRLFGLLGSITAHDEVQLLRSIADPIREYHDHKQSEVDLANAKTPLVPAPQETLPALADALGAEQDHLEPDELIGRASKMLTETGQRRQTQAAYKVTAAQAEMDQLKASVAKRLAVHR